MGDVYPLVLTGGYAVQAHGLVYRLSKDLDVATENPEPMEKIAATLRAGLEQRSRGPYAAIASRSPSSTTHAAPTPHCAAGVGGGLRGPQAVDEPARQISEGTNR